MYFCFLNSPWVETAETSLGSTESMDDEEVSNYSQWTSDHLYSWLDLSVGIIVTMIIIAFLYSFGSLFYLHQIQHYGVFQLQEICQEYQDLLLECPHHHNKDSLELLQVYQSE